MKRITSEQVFIGHPDKLCDLIADSILDECLTQDKNSRVAIECLIKDNLVIIAGEVTTKANVNYSRVALDSLRGVGIFDDFEVIEKISKQSSDIALGVDISGAGDQGIIYGYATNETAECLPLSFVLANKIASEFNNLSNEYPNIFGKDGKCQVTILYKDDGTPIRIHTIVISTQTKPNVSRIVYERYINELLDKVLPNNLVGDKTKILINPTGEFVIGGSYADTGVTGRKLQCDSYGTIAHHGGGAYSGKDYTKVDRSAAYYLRYVAKALVKAGIASEIELVVTYAIGRTSPISVDISKIVKSKYQREYIVELIRNNFNFTPANIINELNLKDIKYKELSSFGHFGKEGYPYEDIQQELINKLET